MLHDKNTQSVPFQLHQNILIVFIEIYKYIHTFADVYTFILIQMHIYIYIYIYPRVRVSSFPALISVAQVNK